MSDVGKWSVVASNNNKPAPDGWPENMAPSDVNNAARENMAAAKRALLQLPYHSTGGVIVYVDSTTFTVADDALDTNYAKYFTEGRKVNMLSPTGNVKGLITQVEYASGVTTVVIAPDDSALGIPTDVTDVLVGITFEDVSHVTGPSMLGMVLPFTASVDSLPFGFGLADGTPFNPKLYKPLADLYFTGNDDQGNPTYMYGTTMVDGNIWPNKPDVRGYFPRFLDNRLTTDEDKVDPDAPRSVGSTQGDAIRNIEGECGNYGNGTGSNYYSSGAMYVKNYAGVPGESEDTQGVSSIYGIDASRTVPTAEENRPTNIAFPGLLVMHGGYASAEEVKPEDLVDTVMDQVAPIVNDRIDGAIATIEENVSDSVDKAQTAAVTAVEAAETAQQATSGKQDKAIKVTHTITPTDWVGTQCSVAVPGMTATDLVMVGPAATEVDGATWAGSGVYASGQETDLLIFTCKSVPSVSLTVNIGVFPNDN